MIMKTWLRLVAASAAFFIASAQAQQPGPLGAYQVFGNPTSASKLGRATDPVKLGIVPAITPQQFGAVGNGVTDDTTAMQSAFTAAAAAGSCVHVPTGSYKITTVLTGSLRCLTGDGYAGYGSSTYTGGVNTSQTTGYHGSTFVCSLTINCVSLTSNDAFLIEKVHFVYPTLSSAFSGFVAITLNSVAGGTNTNLGSIIRDVQIQGADYGMILNDLYEFNVNNVHINNSWIGGIQVNSPNNPSFGDSTIANSTLWGNGTVNHQFHIQARSGGGLRILNNKFNFGGGTTTHCVQLAPSLAIAQSMEPIVITGNSMEGCAIGVAFVNNNVANANISQVVITGNQIWAGVQAISVNSNGTGQWIGGLTVVGNSLIVNAGANIPVNILDNIVNLNWGRNNIDCSGVCTGSSNAVSLLGHIVNGTVGPDTIGASLAIHYSNASAGVVILDPSGVAFSNLPAVAANGSQVFVTNGAPASSPCTGASTGSIAFRQNGAWKCF